MTGYVLSPRAQADIEDIWDYSATQWGVKQAEIYIRKIQVVIEHVAAEPGIARSCDAIRPGYWKYPAGSHVIFFKLMPGGINVIRILHGRMDFERHI